MSRFTYVAFAAVLFATAVAGQELSTFQNADGGYDAYDVSFTLTVSGETREQQNCQAFEGAKPEECLLRQGGVTWDNGDSVTVSFTPNTITGDVTAVEVRMCYSQIDTIDRPWRKVGGDVAANLKGQCKYNVGTVDVAGATQGGSIVWTVPSTTPDAALFPRVFAKCGEDYCGIGNSAPVNPYLFLGVKMNTTPGSLVAAVIICASIGPVLLVGYLGYSCMKGNKAD